MIVKGIATICGKQFRFPADVGYGLILLDGQWTLVEFSCPLESLPPRGDGSVETQSFTLSIEKGRMFWKGQSVHLGEEDAPESLEVCHNVVAYSQRSVNCHICGREIDDHEDGCPVPAAEDAIAQAKGQK